MKSQKKFVVRWPGFEPGPAAWQAAVLARLDYHRTGPILTHPESIYKFFGLWERLNL